MVFNIFTKIFGSNNDRMLKILQPIVDEINLLEPEMKLLSDEQIPQKTIEFKEKMVVWISCYTNDFSVGSVDSSRVYYC